jgi:hypothetical protein
MIVSEEMILAYSGNVVHTHSVETGVWRSDMTITRGVITTVQMDGSMLLALDGYELRCNAMGRRIWERVKEGIPLSIVVTEISNEFKVDTTTVSRDVSEFVDRLKDNLLIEGCVDASNVG